ncbi:MAG TPA: glycosyltransferase family 2 protein [Acidimicrobiales bacterium]|nr:glycosyltransferase family 2 protein [Acidimicrobiales bacterium]
MSTVLASTPVFEGATIVLPVVTETDALEETVRRLWETSEADIAEMLIVVCDRTSSESLERCHRLQADAANRVRLHHQRLPFLGGAMREAFELAAGSHVVMMASDLETDPATVPRLIQVAKEHPNAMVTASRWRASGGFSGYGRLRVGLNWAFQRLTSVVYRTQLTDATYGFRLFPAALLRAISWEGLRHEFLLETLLKPLRLGVEVFEVPTRWTPRQEGQSQNSLSTQARYLTTLVRTRVATPERLLRVNHPV